MSRRWTGIWGVLLALCALLNLGFSPVVTTSDVGGERLFPPQGEMLADTFAGPAITARAAVLYEVDADQWLYTRRPHDRLPPASTTKIATALAALRTLDVEQGVTVGPEVEVEGMGIGLTPGTQVSVKTLLYGMLLNSGNDAAMALAVAAGGSVEDFVAQMNALAAQLGLKDTHFVNPHGLDAPEHYASAYDLAILAREALKDPHFAEIVATPAIDIDGWHFASTNQLLGAYPGVDGVKTGTTDAAGECLVASATGGGHRVIAVVLGSEDRFGDARALLDYYYAYYRWITLELPPGRLVALEPEPEGHLRVYALAQSAQAFLPVWELPWVRHTWEPASGEAGDQVVFWVRDFPLARLPLRVREIY